MKPRTGQNAITPEDAEMTQWDSKEAVYSQVCNVQKITPDVCPTFFAMDPTQVEASYFSLDSGNDYQRMYSGSWNSARFHFSVQHYVDTMMTQRYSPQLILIVIYYNKALT